MHYLKKWVSGALAVGAAVGLVIWLTPSSTDRLVAATTSTGAPTVVANEVREQAPLTLDSPFGSGPGASSAAGASPLSTMSPPRFAADSRGKLVLNSDTHANLEKLLLQEDPQARQATMDQVAKSLPPQAAAELKVLADQFQQYSKALTQSISPENAPENEQEGLKLIDSLHTLRVSYLGAEATQAMFGEEEAATRQIIALMAADKDPTLTQAEKAERAQEVLSKRRQPAG